MLGKPGSVNSRVCVLDAPIMAVRHVYRLTSQSDPFPFVKPSQKHAFGGHVSPSRVGAVICSVNPASSHGALPLMTPG